VINQRLELGFDEIEGGDQILVQSSMIPLNMATASFSFEPEPDTDTAQELRAIAYGYSKIS
jgi:hypothetical protein